MSLNSSGPQYSGFSELFAVDQNSNIYLGSTKLLKFWRQAEEVYKISISLHHRLSDNAQDSFGPFNSDLTPLDNHIWGVLDRDSKRLMVQ